jgi:hypothetical protein
LDVIIAIIATFFAKAIIAISGLSLSISLEWLSWLARSSRSLLLGNRFFATTLGVLT